MADQPHAADVRTGPPASRTGTARTGVVLMVVSLMLATLTIFGGQPRVAGALDAAPGPTTSTGPGLFLPAPNAVPYCDSVTYFPAWPANETNAVATYLAPGFSDTVFADPGDPTSLTSTFTVTAEGNPGPNFPNAGVGGDRPKGFEMEEGDAANVSFSQPFFYPQLIFTDVDRAAEGFTVTPNWSAGVQGSAAAVFGGDANFTASGTVNGVSFDDTDAVGQPSESINGRVQVDFFGVIDSVDFVRTFPSSGQSGFTSAGGCEPIGVAKQATVPVWNEADQKYEVTYTFNITNNLPSDATLQALVAQAQAGAAYSFLTDQPTGITLADIDLTDNLADPRFAQINVTNISNPTGGLPENQAFDGLNDLNLVPMGSQLVPETVETIVVDVEYTPDFTNEAWTTCGPVQLENQAIVSATAAGVPVGDLSDDGVDPGPASNNGSGGANDPTPVEFRALNCDLTLIKDALIAQSGLLADGSFDTSYEITVMNDPSEVDLLTMVSDDPVATFGAGVALSNIALSADGPCAGQENAGWGVGSPDLLAAPVLLDAGLDESCTFLLSFNVLTNPPLTNANLPLDFVNTATATGTNGVISTETQDPATISLVPAADSLVKSGDPGPATAAGQVLNYSIVYTNNGTVMLTGVTITDNLVDIDGCTITSSGAVWNQGDDVPGGQSVTCLATYTVTEADMAAGGDIVNTATSDSDQTDPLVDDHIVPIASDSLDKSGDAGPVTDVGQVLNYTITYINTGNVALTGVTISDSLVTIDGCTLQSGAVFDPVAGGTVPVGETVTCLASYVATAADVDAGGDIVNVATSDSDQTDPRVDDHVVPIEANPADMLDKTGDDGPVLAADQVLNYTITYANVGNATLTGVTITDNLVTIDGCALLTGAVWNQGDSVVPGEIVTCTATYTATQADVDAGGDIVNTATSSSDQTPTSEDDHVVPVASGPADELEKTGDSGPANTVGQVLNYTIAYSNIGNVTLTGVAITDNLVTIDACSLSTGSAWNQGDDVPITEVVTCTATYVVTAADLAAGVDIVNTATSSSDQTPSNEDDHVIGVASDTLDKSSDTPTFSEAGDVITYTITYANTGSIDLTGVRISDPMLPDLSCQRTDTSGFANDGTETVAPATGVVCTGTYVVTQADVDAGDPILNTATSNTNETPPNEDDKVVEHAEITLEKTVLAGGSDCGSAQEGVHEQFVGDVGDAIVWCFTVTNTGNVALADVLLTDLPESVVALDVIGVYGSGNVMVPGETISFALASVIPDGGVVNTAVVSAQPADPDGNPLLGDDGAPAPQVEDENDAVADELSIELFKMVLFGADADCSTAVAGVDEMVEGQPGDAITWCFAVVNDGSANALVTEVVDTVLDVVVPIPAGDQVIAPGTAVIVSTPGIITETPVENVATADATAVDENGDPILDPVTGQPVTDTVDDQAQNAPLFADLSLDKALTPREGGYSPGHTAEYTLTVANLGPDDAQNVVVTDTLPAELSYVELPDVDSWACAAESGVMTCTTPALGNGVSVDLVYTVLVALDAPIGTFKNVASVSSDTPDVNPANNDDAADLPVGGADLALVKSVSSTTAMRGSELTYTLAISNLGPSTAVEPRVVDQLPFDLIPLTLPSVSGWDCSASGGQVIDCTGPDLPAGDTVELVYTVYVAGTAADGKKLVNVAEVSSLTPDPNTRNNRDTEEVAVPVPDPYVYAGPVADEVLSFVETPALAVTGTQSKVLLTVSMMMFLVGGGCVVANRRSELE